MNGQFERILKSVFGHDPWGCGARSEPDAQVAGEVVLSPEQARHGGLCEVALLSARECSDCEGSGHWGPIVCDTCRGTGVCHAHAPLRVRIPAGVTDGVLLPVADDLYLRIRVRR